MNLKKIVVLASGEGTNLQALIDYQKLNLLPIKIEAVFSNVPDCMALSRAKMNQIPTLCLEYNKHKQTRDDYDVIVADMIGEYNPDLVLLLGYMRIVTSSFIERFEHILNLHPALPGENPGNNAIEAAFNKFNKGLVTETGVMIHRVIENVDAGETIDFVRVPILDTDTYETLRTRVRKAEKPLLLGTLSKYLFQLEFNSLKKDDLEVSVPSKKYISGKVRDRFDLGYNLICFYHSDRMSAFDRAICDVPGKGTILNLTSEWWMNQTQHIIPNHLLYVRNEYLIAKKCEVVPLEIIVRGYITGSTNTSLWTHYKNGVRNYCGIDFPDGLVKNQKLPSPVITPTTKGEVDELISYDEILSRKILGKDELDYIYSCAQKLFDYGSKVALEKGLLLVDTKYEFGRDVNGNLMLIDEIHTCDSSRYWLQSTYQESMDSNTEPTKLDKDAIRDYVRSVCNPYEDKIPEIPMEKKLSVLKCYQTLFHMLTGDEISVDVNRVSKINVDPNTNSNIINYFEDYHSPIVVILSGSPSDEWWIEKLRTKCKEENIYSIEHVCSAHKKTRQVLEILDMYNSFKKFGRKIIFITVAGRSNALSGVVACNTQYPVIACPPFQDKADMSTNINSTLQMPSKVPVMTILDPGNVAICCSRIFNLM